MADTPRLIIQLPDGSVVARQLREDAPPTVATGEVVVTVIATDELGNLEPPSAGEVVLSVPSPETLAREAAEVRRVIAHAGTGEEALVIVVEAAEELRPDELDAVLAAAEHTSRAVILRVMRGT